LTGYAINLAIGVAVGGLVIVTTGTLLLINLWKCRRKTKGIANSTSDCYFT